MSHGKSIVSLVLQLPANPASATTSFRSRVVGHSKATPDEFRGEIDSRAVEERKGYRVNYDIRGL